MQDWLCRVSNRIVVCKFRFARIETMYHITNAQGTTKIFLFYQCHMKIR